MKFLILISLLSIGILEASGQSPSAYGNSQDDDPFTAIVNGVPITIPQRSGYSNARRSSPSIQRTEDDSEVIDADEQVFAESRASANGTSNPGTKILRKFLQSLGLNLPAQSANTNDLLAQIIASQITSFAQSLAQTIRDRLQGLRPQVQRQQSDDQVIEMETQLTTLEILYQFFSRPQLLLQLLPQLIPQSSAENRQAANGFAPPRATWEFNRNYTKDGFGGSWQEVPHSGFRASPLGRTFSRLSAKWATTTTTTTTTTTPRPVLLPQQSKGAQIVNRLLSKVGLGTSGSGGAGASIGGGAGGSIGGIGGGAGASAGASAGGGVGTGTGGKTSRFFNKLSGSSGIGGSAGASAGSGAGGSVGASSGASAGTGGAVGTGTGGSKSSRFFNKNTGSGAGAGASAGASVGTGGGAGTSTGGGFGSKASGIFNTLTGAGGGATTSTGGGTSGKSFNILNLGK